MRKNIFLLFVVLGFVPLFAQKSSSAHLVRSTTSVVGSSKKVMINNKTYRIQQSIGQGSVIGMATNGNYTLRQGFIQPNILAKIIDKNSPLTLKVSAYPNPFTEGITLSFIDEVTTDINIVLYDVLGHVLLSKKYTPQQAIHIRLKHLAIGNYLLKIQGNQQQIIKNILKK